MTAAASVQSIVETVPVPPACPSCQTPWNPSGACPSCGLGRTEAIACLASAARAYGHAVQAARLGAFDDAQSHLTDASALGLANHPAVIGLGDLCRDALVPPNDAARAAYQAAHAHAQAGEWAQSAQAAQTCVSAAPAFVPGRKLFLLCLAASGQPEQAERKRRELLPVLPADSDLFRWRFTETSDAADAAAEKHEPRTVRRGRLEQNLTDKPARPHQMTRRERAQAAPDYTTKPPIVSSASLVLAFCALVTAFAALFRPAPIVQIVPAPPAPAPVAVVQPKTAAPPFAPPILSPVFQAEAAAARRRADEQTARQWLNAAVRAKNAKQWRHAQTLAHAARLTAPPGSYLLPDTLLVEAQAADNEKESAADAAALFGQIAADPFNPYQAVALRRLRLLRKAVP